MPDLAQTVILFRGAGDVATGAALRLYGAGLRRLSFLEIPQPMAVRRTVSFSEAVYEGRITVEGVTALRAETPADFASIWARGAVPVLVDPAGRCVADIRPEVVVEATIAKTNIGVTRADAPLVIGVGPGFTAGEDVHRVVETKRGFLMGRLLREGSAAPNTGRPGVVMGYDVERVLRAPCSGLFETSLDIGDAIRAGEAAGTVDGTPVLSQIDGIIRGLLRSGLRVAEGAKLGDVEPRNNVGFDKVSDKGMAVGGALLEAVLEHVLLG